MEGIMKDRLTSYLTEHKLISPNQHGQHGLKKVDMA